MEWILAAHEYSSWRIFFENLIGGINWANQWVQWINALFYVCLGANFEESVR